MTNPADTEIADALVEAGIGKESTPYRGVINGFYTMGRVEENGYGIDEDDPWQEADQFVRDPRVAMECLKRMIAKDQILIGQEPNGVCFADNCTSGKEFDRPSEDESLERAIVLAYVESLK